MSRFRGPVRRKGDRYVIEIGADETALIARLTGELRALLTDPEPGPEAAHLLLRLFPLRMSPAAAQAGSRSVARRYACV